MKNNTLMIVIAVLVILGLGLYLMRNRSASTTVTSTTPAPDTAISFSTPPPSGAVTNIVTLALAEENTSGQSGTYTLTEDGGKTFVVINLTGFTNEVSQPAHIHVGKCPEVGAVKYPLTNVVNGKSETTLNVTLAQLRSELPLGLNVHKSDAEAKIYTACGDVIL